MTAEATFKPILAFLEQQYGIRSQNMPSLWQRFIFEMAFALSSDPWKHTSPHQQTKSAQTLKLLGSTPIARALELGCAQGDFTVQLAPHVGSLIAADISQIALTRAQARCAIQRLENVSFVHLDLIKDKLPADFELIVCGEVLYYISGQTALQAVAHKLVAALQPGGYLLTTHALRVDEESERTRFDLICPFGAKLIGKTLTNTSPLRLVKEFWTPFYGIQLFQRSCSMGCFSHSSLDEGTKSEEVTLPDPERGTLDLFSLAFLYNQLQRWRRGSVGTKQ